MVQRIMVQTPILLRSVMLQSFNHDSWFNLKEFNWWTSIKENSRQKCKISNVYLLCYYNDELCVTFFIHTMYSWIDNKFLFNWTEQHLVKAFLVLLFHFVLCAFLKKKLMEISQKILKNLFTKDTYSRCHTYLFGYCMGLFL